MEGSGNQVWEREVREDGKTKGQIDKTTTQHTQCQPLYTGVCWMIGMLDADTFYRATEGTRKPG